MTCSGELAWKVELKRRVYRALEVGTDRCAGLNACFDYASDGNSSLAGRGSGLDALDRVEQTPHPHFVDSYLSAADATPGPYAVPYGEHRDLVGRMLAGNRGSRTCRFASGSLEVPD